MHYKSLTINATHQRNSENLLKHKLPGRWFESSKNPTKPLAPLRRPFCESPLYYFDP